MAGVRRRSRVVCRTIVNLVFVPKKIHAVFMDRVKYDMSCPSTAKVSVFLRERKQYVQYLQHTWSLCEMHKMFLKVNL